MIQYIKRYNIVNEILYIMLEYNIIKLYMIIMQYIRISQNIFSYDII